MIADMPATLSGAAGSSAAAGSVMGAVGGAMPDSPMAEDGLHSSARARVAVEPERIVAAADAGSALGDMGGDMGGVLASCVAFLVLAVVALVGLPGPRRWRTIAPPPATPPSVVWDAVPARPAGLARLCVLRI